MKTIHALFEDQAQVDPDKIAIVCSDKRITYRDLDESSRHLAGVLVQSGVMVSNFVVVFLERSPEAIIAMLAVLKAGGAYVPIDISTPRERISYLINDCSPAVILTSKNDIDRLPTTSLPVLVMDDLTLGTTSTEIDYPANINKESPAYIIYTSGTTGMPKGVVVPHRGVVRLVTGQEYITFGPDKIFLQMASLAFDAATFEIWGALLHGGTCVMYPGDTLPDPATLQQLIAEENITTAWLTATLFNTLVTIRPNALQGLSELITGGEALSVYHVRKALNFLPDTTLVNGYGPTENTTFTACYRIPKTISPECTSIPIGRPLRQTTAYILDDQKRVVLRGEVGELHVGGAGLALGYLNLPEQTTEKFIDLAVNGEPAQRLYRTGDLVRLLPDGNLDYVGRIDDQVKIRGFRIEPGEITSVLLEYPGISEAVVAVHTDDCHAKHLVAYVVLEKEHLDSGKLRAYLSTILPDYMVPSIYIQIDHVPVNRNGKLDRKQLPQPSFCDRSEIIEPGTPVEKQLVPIWCSILKQSRISITDNFFDIGGTSLLGMELIDTINKKLLPEPALDPVLLYQFPTIRSLAGHLSSRNQEADGSVQTRGKLQKAAFGRFRKARR